MPERVLVTGATGFLGSALCRALVAQGYSVRALHRPTSPLLALEGLTVERVVGDILSPPSLGAALDGIDWVFHTASQSAYWRHPQDVITSAIDGTRNVVSTALRARCRRLVLTSSVAALGVPASGELLTERHAFNLPEHRFPYGFAKHQAELEALRTADGRLEVVIVNPAVVLGAGDLNQISGSLVVEAARGWTFVYTDGGVNVVHIDDVSAGHIAAARRGRAGERYILGGENLTHREILTTVAEIVGRRPPWLKLPRWAIGPLASAIDVLERVARLPMNGDQMRMSRHYLFCDTTKARSELGLAPPIPFRRAAQDAYDWYHSQGVI